MKLFSILFVFGAALLSLSMSTFSSQANEVWVVQSSSSLVVDGKTNINSFECIIPAYGKFDTLVCSPSSAHNRFAVSGHLSIPINNFDCGHKMMTKDLQKTLRSNEYPYMGIKFLHFNYLPSMPGISVVVGSAEIELAGVKRNFDISFKVKRNNSRAIEMLGTKELLFSDFNLKPPSKLGGTIKVKNELNVVFNLKMNLITN